MFGFILGPVVVSLLLPEINPMLTQKLTSRQAWNRAMLLFSWFFSLLDDLFTHLLLLPVSITFMSEAVTLADKQLAGGNRFMKLAQCLKFLLSIHT